MNTKLKQINAHDDYVMFQLICNFHQAINCLMAYMQDTTPYGEEYEKAYKEICKVQNRYKYVENALQECVERKLK